MHPTTRTQSLITVLLFALLAAIPLAHADDGFPGRSLFPHVAFMDGDTLKRRFDAVTIIDVRSDYEYNTLHIKGALNIPYAGENFVDEVTKLRASNDKPIVFYCNGRSCRVSYQACDRAQRNGVENTFAYDAGIFEWAQANPDRAVLLGQSPIPPNALISTAQFKARQLDPEAFLAKVGPNSMILDVRDNFQRDAISLFPFQEQRVPLNDMDKLRQVVQEAKAQRKTLLIYDAVGRQVRWLQYSLEALGASDYYFMAGGEQAFYDMLSSGKGAGR